MKTVGDIRRANLERLIEQVKKLEAVAEAAGTTSVYLSQIRNQAKDAKTGKPREMGSKMARRIEEGMKKPAGWLDIDHSLSGDPPSDEPVASGGERTLDELLVNSLADRLLGLPPLAAERSVDACRRLAESPDSRRSREALVELLSQAPGVAPIAFFDAKVRRARMIESTSAMLADRWPVDGEREVIHRFLETVTQFMTETRGSPKRGTSSAPGGDHTKATTREN